MKKILIPTLLTIATTPLISMVSCNHGPERIEMNVDRPTPGGWAKPMLDSAPFSIQVGKPYRFNVDISNDTVYEETTNQITFWIFSKDGDEKVSDASYDIVSIVVDGKTLVFDPDVEYELDKPNTYMIRKIQHGMAVEGLLLQKMTETSTATIDLIFTSNDSTGEVYFQFTNGTG